MCMHVCICALRHLIEQTNEETKRVSTLQEKSVKI